MKKITSTLHLLHLSADAFISILLTMPAVLFGVCKAGIAMVVQVSKNEKFG